MNVLGADFCAISLNKRIRQFDAGLWLKDDLHGSAGTDREAVSHMPLGEPTSDAALNFDQKVQAALVCKAPKIANQVRDGMLIVGPIAPLKGGDGFSSPGDELGLERIALGKRCSHG
jgi:hypothetical protein